MFWRMNRITVAFALNILAGILFACSVPVPVSAQNSPILPATSSITYTPGGMAPPKGAVPPPGSGPIAAPVNYEDKGKTSPLVPKNMQQPDVPAHGNMFAASQTEPQPVP